MGCDIHSFAEVKENGSWKVVEDYRPFQDRNYQLFALLADVRNGSGFAGCDTGNHIEPISIPKGLPKDCSAKVQLNSDDWDIDGHSHSWLTLKELLDYDSSTIITRRGFVTAEKYKDFLKTGDPYPCCGGVGGWGVEIVDKDIAISYQETNPDKSVYCQIEWQRSIEDTAYELYEKVIPELKVLSSAEDFSDVRVVFWFDN